MISWITNLQLPHEVLTFILAMIPISELRGTIPIALGIFHMPLVWAFLLSWLGSIVPGIFLVYTLNFFSKWLSARSTHFKKFFDWLFERTYRRFWKHHERLGSAALLIFVAIPLPITGVWTGSVAAFLFGIPKKLAIILIGAGSFIAGVIVTLIYYGFITLFNSII